VREEHRQGDAVERGDEGAWTRWAWVVVGAAMVILLGLGIRGAIPDRTAVRLERQGLRALKAGDYPIATRRLAAVLDAEPKSAHAYFALACISFLTGHRSRAAMELTDALENGLPLGPIGDCGSGLRLDRRFFAAKLGLTTAFAVPRGVPDGDAYERMLSAEPPGTDGDDVNRFLTGSCLAFRSGLEGLGWFYAASAEEIATVGPRAERRFLECLDARTLARLRCSARPGISCLLSDRIRRSYVEERTRPFGLDAPR